MLLGGRFSREDISSVAGVAWRLRLKAVDVSRGSRGKGCGDGKRRVSERKSLHGEVVGVGQFYENIILGKRTR